MNAFRILVHPHRGHEAVKIGIAWPALAFGPAWLAGARLRARAAMLGLALLAVAGAGGWIVRTPTGVGRTAGGLGVGCVALAIGGWAGRRGNRWKEARLVREGYANAGQVNAPSASQAIARWQRTIGSAAPPSTSVPPRRGRAAVGVAAAGVLVGGIVVAFVAGARLETLANLDRTLRADPLWRELAHAAPDLYGRVRGRCRTAAQHGDDVPRVAAEMGRALTPEILRRYMPSASDPAVIGFDRARLDQVEELRSQSTEAAFRVAFPQPGDAAGSPGDDGGRDRDAAALAEVVRTGATRRYAPPDTARARQLLDGLTATLHRDHAVGLAALGNPHGPGADPARAVDAYVALHEVILAQPPADAAMLLRFIEGH